MKNQIGIETLKHLAKEYRSLGLSKIEAKLAARMEGAVSDIEEPSRPLSLRSNSVRSTAGGLFATHVR